MYKICMEKYSDMLICRTQHALKREVGCEDRNSPRFMIKERLLNAGVILLYS